MPGPYPPKLRLTSAIFRAGMVADLMVTDQLPAYNPLHGAPSYLKNCCIGRHGEIVGQQFRQPSQLQTLTSDKWAGASMGAYHPDLGVMTVQGRASSQLAAASGVLQASAYEPVGCPITGITDFQSMASGSWNVHGSAVAVTPAGGTSPYELAFQSTNLPSEIVWAGYAGKLYKWAGAAASASASGASAASGAYWAASSNVVSCTAATGFTNIIAGMYLLLDAAVTKDGTTGESVALRVVKKIDASSVVVERRISTAVLSAARVAWRAQPIAVIQSGGASAQAWNAQDRRPRSMGVVAYHQGRLFDFGIADGDYNSLFDFNAGRWSGTTDANAVSGVGGSTGATQYSHVDYWDPGAKAQFAPGLGGVIRGAVSVGNELVIIKSNALLRLVGTVTDYGVGDARIEVISNAVGSRGWQGWCVTPIGLVVAHETGLWLYDGTKVTNMLEGRMQSWWDAAIVGKRMKELTVTCSNHRMYVCAVSNNVISTSVTPPALVYDFTSDAFSLNDGGSFGMLLRKVLNVSDVNDLSCGHWGMWDRYPNAHANAAVSGVIGSSPYMWGMHTELTDVFPFLTSQSFGFMAGYDYGEFAMTVYPEMEYSFMLVDGIQEARIKNHYVNMAHTYYTTSNSGTKLVTRMSAKGLRSQGFDLGASAPTPNVMYQGTQWHSDTAGEQSLPVNNWDVTYRIPSDYESGEHRGAYCTVNLSPTINYFDWRVFGIALDIEICENTMSDGYAS